MAVFRRYDEIEAWKAGRELVREVYALTRKGDFAKDFGLKDQIQRAAVSVCSNIAEGFERRGNKAAMLQNLIKSISTSKKGLSYTH